MEGAVDTAGCCDVAGVMPARRLSRQRDRRSDDQAEQGRRSIAAFPAAAKILDE